MKNKEFKAIEREKKYPVLTTIDLILHQGLLVGVVGLLGFALWKCVLQSPQLTASATVLTSRLLGINLD